MKYKRINEKLYSFFEEPDLDYFINKFGFKLKILVSDFYGFKPIGFYEQSSNKILFNNHLFEVVDLLEDIDNYPNKHFYKCLIKNNMMFLITSNYLESSKYFKTDKLIPFKRTDEFKDKLVAVRWLNLFRRKEQDLKTSLEYEFNRNNEVSAEWFPDTNESWLDNLLFKRELNNKFNKEFQLNDVIGLVFKGSEIRRIFEDDTISHLYRGKLFSRLDGLNLQGLHINYIDYYSKNNLIKKTNKELSNFFHKRKIVAECFLYRDSKPFAFIIRKNKIRFEDYKLVKEYVERYKLNLIEI